MRLPMKEFPRVAAWEKRMRAIPLVAADLERARKAMAGADLATSSRAPTAVSIGATAGWNGPCVMALSISLRANSMQVR